MVGSGAMSDDLSSGFRKTPEVYRAPLATARGRSRAEELRRVASLRGSFGFTAAATVFDLIIYGQVTRPVLTGCQHGPLSAVSATAVRDPPEPATPGGP